MQQTTARSFAVPAGEGETIRIGANLIRVLVPAEATRGALSLVDYVVPAGFPGPPLHVHPAFDEVFLVEEGRIDLRLGEGVVTATAGSVVRVAGDEPHTFANPTAEPARMRVAMTPGGFEAYFRDLAAAGDGGVPDPSEAARLGALHGVRPIA